MADSQAEAVRDLLVERLEIYDPTLDVSEGSPLWSQVIEPIFERLGTDPFDTDIRSFLKDRLAQEFPSISAEEGDAIADILITPLEVLFEPLKREIQILRAGQSAENADTMRLEDAKALAANFFTTHRSGSRASALVRVYYASPTYVNVLATTVFKTSSGLRFFPTTPLLIRPEVMLLQRSGTEYYIEVPVLAEESGTASNVGKGQITSAEGLTGYTRITNLAAAEPGTDAETTKELLDRTKSSLTERSLNVRRGIVARLKQDFPSIVDVEAIGYGDPEMERDILTGGGQGTTVAAGVCFIVGQFVLMFSTFENRGEDYARTISEGDEIELNFWNFLYGEKNPNEVFTVDTILFDSRNTITEMPSVLLFRIDGVPSVTAPIAGTLPGVLPGVFCVVRTTGKLEISDIPGGILNPDTARGTIEIEDGEVHIGGHYDVWMRPSGSEAATAEMTDIRSETAHVEGDDLVVSGAGSEMAHMVHRAYKLSILKGVGNLQLGETVSGGTSGAYGVISGITATGASTRVLELWEMDGTEFEEGEALTGGTTGATATLTALDTYDWEDDGLVEAGMLLSIVKGTEEGVYRILKVEGPFLYLDVELTTTAKGVVFRVLDEVQVNIFSPKSILVPFGDADGTDLRTTIGSATLRTGINLQDYGVDVGDTIEILDGDDKGVYTIQEFDSGLGGTAPVVAVQMTATNSNVSYTVYRTTTPLQRPLIRINPGRVALLDPSGQDSGYTVPPALPVDARSVGAFSGSKAVAVGSNGFVLMDPGDTWAPTDDYVTDIDTYDWSLWTGGDFEEFYKDGNFKRCFTDECVDCEGYLAVISIYDDGSMYLDSNLPSNVTTFLQDMKTWFLGVISSFNFGGDEEELVNAFSPLKFGPNADTAVSLLMQFEVCIPFAVFDGCNNVFVGIPEFDWEAEFEEADNFEEAVGRYNDGAMVGNDPALLQGKGGDILTVLNGPNAGSYVIEEVHQYYLVTAGALGETDLDLEDAYKVGVAVIRDEFPVPPLQGLPEYFSGTSPSWSVPTSPDLPFEVFDSSGASVDGWDWVSTSLTWFFQWMDSLGFDLPSDVELDVQETMKAFWQLLFSDYIISRPTCGQYVRLHFVEPTSCTVYAPQACARYQWAPPIHSGEALVGEDITLPIPDLEDLALSLTVRRLEGDTTLQGTLDSDAATAATLEELAALVQAALDPDADYITVSGPADATGALTITQVAGGVDEWLFIDAKDVSEGFFWLGFFESEPGLWAYEESIGPAASDPYEKITTNAGHAIGFGYRLLSTDVVTLELTAASGAIGFTIGETVEGQTSNATGVLFAICHDTTGAEKPTMWLTSTTGTFVNGEQVLGLSSGDSSNLTADPAALAFTRTMSDNQVSVNNTFEEQAEDLTDALELRFNNHLAQSNDASDYDDIRWSSTFIREVTWNDNGDGSGYFEITIYDTNYTAAHASWELSDTGNTSFDDPEFASTYMMTVTPLPATSTSGVITGDDYTPSATSPTINVDYDGSDLFDVDFGLDYFSALTFKTSVLDLIDASDFEGAAQALNATAAYYADTTSGSRAVLWVGTGSKLIMRVLSGGPDTDETATDLDLLGFLGISAGTEPEANTIVQGTTEPDDTRTVFHGAHEPTLFVAAAGAAELLFTPSLEADPFQVFPGQDEDGDIPSTELPRDLEVGTPYDDQLASELAFTDASYASPIELGLQEGADWLWLYEHLTMLEHTTIETDALVSRDRVVAGFTEFGSNIITIPEFDSDEYTFLAPSVTTAELPDHRVEVGDLLFIEEGDDEGGYTVIARTAHTLTLDRTLSESTTKVYSVGNDGVIEPDASEAYFRSTGTTFTESDVGRWLTIWGTNRDDYDGSYEITAVDTSTNTLTLDTEVWAETETDIHFAVVKAPLSTPGDSATGGRTELVGLRPFRLYRGTPTKWRVSDISPHLTRSDARVYVSHGGETTGPRVGVKQPYKFVRPGAQRISSTAMSEQVDCGFYYQDVLVHSLGGDEVYNIPEDVKMEPVFGTYDSEGYRLEVEDNRLTFSTSEECALVFTPTFLPVGFDDRPTNLLKLENRSYRVAYEYAPVVAQIQRMMTSETDRVLCANVLARHFLPSYVTFCLAYEGGNKPSVVASDIIDYINGLPAVEVLDVSKLEKYLHKNVVTRYPHPVYIWTLTHDLDRRMVAMRSIDRISDDDIPFNGTNRTTFFIAGDDYSATENETDIPYGERVYLTRGIAPSTVR